MKKVILAAEDNNKTESIGELYVKYGMEDDFGKPGKSRNEELDDMQAALSSAGFEQEGNRIRDIVERKFKNSLGNSAVNDGPGWRRAKVEDYESGERGIFYGPSLKEVAIDGDDIIVVLWTGRRYNRNYFVFENNKLVKSSRREVMKYYSDRQTIFGDPDMDI